jgi:hypothetical protein
MHLQLVGHIFYGRFVLNFHQNIIVFFVHHIVDTLAVPAKQYLLWHEAFRRTDLNAKVVRIVSYEII